MNRILKLIRRFLELPRAKRRLLLQAATLVVGSRVGLRLLPFSYVRRFLTNLATPQTTPSGRVSHGGVPLNDVIWAVEAVGRHLPAFGTCLTQALSAHVLTGRSGLKSDLRIGVTKTQDGNFEAHAWLESGGLVIIGGRGHTDFTPMPVLNGLDPPSRLKTEP